MKGRDTFTAAEANAIRRFLVELRASDRGAQKRIRRTLRNRYRFHISDFSIQREGFTMADFDSMVRGAAIRILN